MVSVFFTLVFSITSFGFYSDAYKSSLNETFYVVHCSKAQSKYINMDSITVREFVEKLRYVDTPESVASEKTIKNSLILNGLFTVNKAPKNWLSYEDVEFLISLISSEERAKCVIQTISSELPGSDEHSTLGGQVMNIIDSFRLNKPYPYLLSDCSITESGRAEEIMLWWNQYKKK